MLTEPGLNPESSLCKTLPLQTHLIFDTAATKALDIQSVSSTKLEATVLTKPGLNPES